MNRIGFSFAHTMNEIDEKRESISYDAFFQKDKVKFDKVEEGQTEYLKSVMQWQKSTSVLLCKSAQNIDQNNMKMLSLKKRIEELGKKIGAKEEMNKLLNTSVNIYAV